MTILFGKILAGHIFLDFCKEQRKKNILNHFVDKIYFFWIRVAIFLVFLQFFIQKTELSSKKMLQQLNSTFSKDVKINLID